MPTQDAPRSSAAARDLAIVGAVCALAFFWRLGTPGLFDFNEGLYAEAAREMVLRSDYVTGHVNGIAFYDKPPLALWAAAAAFHVLGITEFAARLPVALASSLIAFATYWMGAVCFSRRAGLLAATFFAFSPIVLGTSRQMTMDMHQSLWVTMAMLAMLCALRSKRGAGPWWMGFWVSCGMGFMAKSFPGLLPLPIAVTYFAWTTRLRPAPLVRALLSMRPAAGLALLIAVVAPWHVMAYVKDGSFFVHEYWTLHHVGLLRATEFDHAQPVWYYAPALLAAFYPWSFLLPLAGLRDRSLEQDSERRRHRTLALVWAVVTLLLFSAMRSKLVSYLIPMLPAVALIAADGMDRLIEHGPPRGRARSWPLAVLIAAVAALQIAGAVAVWRLLPERMGSVSDPEAVPLLGAGMVRYASLAVGAMALGATGAALLAWRSARAGIAGLAVTMAVFVALTWEIGMPAYDRAVGLPLRRAVARAAEAAADGTPLVIHIGRPRRPSAFFYLPSRMLKGPLPTDRRTGLLLEEWEPSVVQSYVLSRPSTLVLADRARGTATLAGIGGVREVYRSGRWGLFLVEKARGLP